MADETLDLDELERLAREAPPGPWGVPAGSKGSDAMVVADWDVRVCDYVNEYNAAFIAAANPAEVIALVTRLRVAEHRVLVLRAYCEGGITFACLTAEDIADALGLPEPEVPDGTD